TKPSPQPEARQRTRPSHTQHSSLCHLMSSPSSSPSALTHTPKTSTSTVRMDLYPSPPRSSPYKSVNIRPLCKRPAPPVTPPNQMLRNIECPGAPSQRRIISLRRRVLPRKVMLVEEARAPVTERM